MENYWIQRSLTIVESEVILVKASPTTREWFDRMPRYLTAICPDLIPVEFFGPKIGHAYHIRLTKWGIEGILKAPRKFHRYQLFVLFDNAKQPQEPFWLVLHK